MSINDVLFYLYSGIPLLNFVMLLVAFITLYKITVTKKQLDEFARILYLSIKKEEYLTSNTDDTRNQLSQLSEAFESLSSSTNTVVQELQSSYERDDRIWPTPQLAEMVGATIREQLYTELTLSRKMRIPNQDSIKNVITIATDTYPHVSIDYITRRTFAEVENMQRQQNQQQTE